MLQNCLSFFHAWPDQQRLTNTKIQLGVMSEGSTVSIVLMPIDCYKSNTPFDM